MELNHATARGNESNNGRAAQTPEFESREPPLDCVYCIPSGTRSPNAQAVDVLDKVASYLALETTPDARAVIRSCRAAQSPREQSIGRTLYLRKFGISSLAEQKRGFINKLSAELADAVKRHWLTKDDRADWERLVREETQAANAQKLAAATDGDSGETPVAPVNDTTPLALRGRFKEQMSLVFASEVLLQIQGQLESRDDRGRPLILPRDAKLIADTARAVVSLLSTGVDSQSSMASRFAESAELRPLIAAGSQRVIRQAIEKFDLRQPERFLPVDAIDELVQDECHALLEESLVQPDFAAPLTALMDLDQAMAGTLENATSDLLQCGCERRTLMFVPQATAHAAAAEKLRSVRPLAAIIPAGVDDLIVVSEETSISPRSLALGLERVFPGISDAARRLLTRIDVEWQSLI
jgi:hypothetical protein